MGVGSGLGAQLVIGDEGASYGTAATLDHSYEFDSETVAWAPQWMDDTGLHAGGEFARLARTTVNTFEAAGSIPMDFVTNKMGLLVKHMLGSAGTPTQISTTTAYKQVHQDGPLTGKSLSAQIGRPQTDGTVKPFTGLGGKIQQWALSCSVQQRLKLALDWNFQDVSTATGLASFATVAGAAPFDWKQASLKFGGTASTSGGVVSISGGVTVATVITGVTLTGQNPMNTGLYGIGGNGKHSEPVSNARRVYTLGLNGNFTSQSEIYDVYRAFTTVPVQLTFTGSQIGASGNNFSLDIILSGTKIRAAAPNVSGPDVVQQNVSLEVGDDEANARIQITLVSSDTAL